MTQDAIEFLLMISFCFLICQSRQQTFLYIERCITYINSCDNDVYPFYIIRRVLLLNINLPSCVINQNVIT